MVYTIVFLIYFLCLILVSCSSCKNRQSSLFCICLIFSILAYFIDFSIKLKPGDWIDAIGLLMYIDLYRLLDFNDVVLENKDGKILSALLFWIIGRVGEAELIFFLTTLIFYLPPLLVWGRLTKEENISKYNVILVFCFFLANSSWVHACATIRVYWGIALFYLGAYYYFLRKKKLLFCLPFFLISVFFHYAVYLLYFPLIFAILFEYGFLKNHKWLGYLGIVASIMGLTFIITFLGFKPVGMDEEVLSGKVAHYANSGKSTQTVASFKGWLVTFGTALMYSMALWGYVRHYMVYLKEIKPQYESFLQFGVYFSLAILTAGLTDIFFMHRFMICISFFTIVAITVAVSREYQFNDIIFDRLKAQVRSRNFLYNLLVLEIGLAIILNIGFFRRITLRSW